MRTTSSWDSSIRRKQIVSLENFRERLGKFGLELHPDKTRRIEFGRFAEQNRERRGEGKPETFDFLGFTHISGKNRLGRFRVRRKTIRKRMRAKLREIKQQLRARMHDPVRKERYEDLGGVKEVNDCLIKTVDGCQEFSGTLIPHKPFDPIVIKAPVAPGDVIVLCSDGINSYRHADDTPVDWRELVNDFVGFKNYEGVFVQRRMSALRHKCQKQLISHTDDISVAAIVV